MEPSRGYTLETKCTRKHGICRRHSQAFSIHSISLLLSVHPFFSLSLSFYSVCSLFHLMASGSSTNVVSVSACPFQYRPISFLFSSVLISLFLFLLLSFSPFSCPPCIVWLRLEGQWGVARAEWNLIWICPWMDTVRLQEIHQLFFGLPWWFLSSSVTGVLPCITKNRFWQEQMAAQLVIVLEKMLYWVITKRWCDTSESVQMFHSIKFTIRETLDLSVYETGGSLLVNWFMFKKYKILCKNLSRKKQTILSNESWNWDRIQMSSWELRALLKDPTVVDWIWTHNLPILVINFVSSRVHHLYL